MRLPRTSPTEWARDPTPPPPGMVWVRHQPTRQLFPVPSRTWDDFQREDAGASRWMDDTLRARETRGAWGGEFAERPFAHLKR